jgi:HD-like signal output (HDOD) protein
MRAEPRARIVILALYVENDDRALPCQQIGNDDAGAFARAGWRFDEDMLAAAKGQETPAFASDDDAGGSGNRAA